MKIALEYKITKSSYEENDFIDELSPFENNLDRLRAKVTGEISIFFDKEKKIILDLHADFLTSYSEIIYSINAAKIDKKTKKTIYFCEQGSDFYIDYEIKNEIIIGYRKGKKVGRPNSEINEFQSSENLNNYVNEWKVIFNEINKLFDDFLQRKLSEKDMPILN